MAAAAAEARMALSVTLVATAHVMPECNDDGIEYVHYYCSRVYIL
jgi:hypothetical protein